MQKTLYIPIDTTFDFTFECPLLVKKYDTLKLKIAIFDKGLLKDLTEQTVNLVLRKADGTNIEKTIADKTLNIASIVLDKQASSCAGKVQGEVIIADSTGQTTTNTFVFNVINSLTENIQIKSEDNIDTLQDMRALIAAYKNEITAIGESVQATEALNNITVYIENNLNELTSKNASAVANIKSLKTENDRADSNIPNLNTLNDVAEEKLEEFRLYDKTNLIKQVQDNTTYLNANTNEISTIKTDYALKTDVNTLASNKAEKSALETTNANVAKNTTDIATQKARIDSFTKLAEGSTTGDAELQDIRVKADGITAKTAGNAVREQFNSVKDITSFLTKYAITKKNYDVVGITSNGTGFSSASKYQGVRTFVKNVGAFDSIEFYNIQSSDTRKITVKVKSQDLTTVYAQKTFTLDADTVADFILSFDKTISTTEEYLCIEITMENSTGSITLAPPFTCLGGSNVKEVYTSSYLDHWTSVSLGYALNIRLLTKKNIDDMLSNILSSSKTYTDNAKFIKTATNYNLLTDAKLAEINQIYCFSNGTCSNLPVSSTGVYGTLISFGISSTYKNAALYLFRDNVGKALYIMEYSGNAYGNWQKLYTESDHISNIIIENMSALNAFSDIAIVGDSLASGYLQLASGTVQNRNKAWIKVFEQLGVNTTRQFSTAGLTTRTWLTDANGLAKMQEEGANVELIFIGLGVNDVGMLGSDYLGVEADVNITSVNNCGDTFYGNYARIIHNIKTYCPHAKIICLTMPNADYYTDRVVFNTAIKYNATKFGCIVFDLASDWRYSAPPLNKTLLGGHYSAIGYSFMGHHLARKLNEYCKEHPSEFEYLGFATQ